jgi:hypothetical protein
VNGRHLGMAGPLDVRVPDAHQVVALLHTANLQTTSDCCTVHNVLTGWEGGGVCKRLMDTN